MKFSRAISDASGMELSSDLFFSGQCQTAKLKNTTLNYDLAITTYNAYRLRTQEAVGSEADLDFLRPHIFKTIDFLTTNNFRRLANQLEEDFKEAELQTENATFAQSPDTHFPNIGTPKNQSSGTCFFIDGFGTAITNNHVIDGYTNLLGDKPKYSEGTISALSGLNNDDSWIQMSTPIQPGNSGGPLVDLNGHVVGIVTAAHPRIDAVGGPGSCVYNRVVATY